MPKPRAGEGRDAFISRCIPILIGEGRERDQAIAVCHSLWSEKNKSSMNNFLVTKQANGRYRWFAVYSNPYRDRDFPPEILSETAQIDFAKSVNESSWPYPELWLYHIPGSRVGVSDFIAYDTDNRLAVASGEFDAGKERVAEALNSTPVPLLVSHGFPRTEIRRDENDPTIITRFRSKEISPLPADAAANELTGFKILDSPAQSDNLGGNMNLVPDAVKERLERLMPGKSDEIAEVLDVMGDEAKEADLEFKEAEVEEKEAEEKEVEEKEAEVETEVDDTETDEKETDEKETDEDALDRKEVEDAVKMLVGALEVLTDKVKTLEDTNAELISQLTSLTDIVTSIQRSDEEKMAEQATLTPRLSLSEIIANSAIGKQEVQVDGRKARHEGPQETKISEVNSGHPALDGVISNIINGSWRPAQGGQ